jgi:alkylhydroperoxidase family enzyme
MDGAEAKIEATWDPSDPLFSPRERAALEMASIFTENYQDFTDEDLIRWRERFSDVEIIELATFMALADGFGKVVEMLGLGAGEQAGRCEL